MEAGRKKVAVIGVSSLLLVAMVVAVTIGVNQNADAASHHREDVSTSVKAIKGVCAPTDYQQVCVKSLSSTAGNTTDPKELVKAAFQVAITKIQEAAKNSSLLQKLQEDPRTKEALENCQDLAQAAANDLKRSFDEMGKIDASKFDDLLANLKIWLSGAITYQETCLDGFENTTGDAGEKMKGYLKTAMELTSNGLAMVTEISNALSSLNIQGFNRRLLALGYDGFPFWFSDEGRKLVEQNQNKINPNVVVAQDGSGKYKTIKEALEEVPRDNNKTFVIYIKKGVYDEKVQINKTMTHVMIVGDGPEKTKITGRRNFIDGTTTFHTATFVVLGDFFIAKDIGFENAAGPEKHQAVALRVGADKTIFYNCRMDGYQDTLYAHTYRQFYRDCVITGTIDFIFGDSAAIFQNCKIIVRKPLSNQANIVTAQGRKEKRQPTGIVLQNCTITADPSYHPVRNQLKSYLGRPWKEHSRTIIMESYIDDLIQPDGWLPWNGTFGLDTCFYSEYNNRGPSSSKQNRVQWKGVKEVTKARIQLFTASEFLWGDSWIPKAGVPYALGLIYPPPPDSSKALELEKGEKSEESKERKKEDYEYKGKEQDTDSGREGSRSKSKSKSRSSPPSKSGEATIPAPSSTFLAPSSSISAPVQAPSPASPAKPRSLFSFFFY